MAESLNNRSDAGPVPPVLQELEDLLLVSTLRSKMEENAEQGFKRSIDLLISERQNLRRLVVEARNADNRRRLQEHMVRVATQPWDENYPLEFHNEADEWREQYNVIFEADERIRMLRLDLVNLLRSENEKAVDALESFQQQYEARLSPSKL